VWRRTAASHRKLLTIVRRVHWAVLRGGAGSGVTSVVRRAGVSRVCVCVAAATAAATGLARPRREPVERRRRRGWLGSSVMGFAGAGRARRRILQGGAVAPALGEDLPRCE